MNKETKEKFETIIYDANERARFIDKTFVTPSSLQFLEKSVYSFILSKLEPIEQTQPMRFGSALHEACLFGMLEYSNKYAVLPPEISSLNKNSNAYKDGLKAFLESNTEKEILSIDEHNLICDMQASFVTSEIYEEIFSEANEKILIEEQIEFMYNGVKCRGRLDAASLKNSLWTVYDLKTTQDSLDLDGLSKSINQYKYYRQLEMYRMAISSKYDEDIEMKLVFLGKEYPNLPVTVDRLDDKYYDTAKMDIFFLTEKWREFIENRDYMTMQDKYQSRVNFSAPLWLKSVATY